MIINLQSPFFLIRIILKQTQNIIFDDSEPISLVSFIGNLYCADMDTTRYTKCDSIAQTMQFIELSK